MDHSWVSWGPVEVIEHHLQLHHIQSLPIGPAWPTPLPPTPPPHCSSEGPLIRVICVSHHLVSLRTHWSLADSSLRPSCCFCFWCGRFIWPFWSWGHFLEAGDRMLFLTGFPVVRPKVKEKRKGLKLNLCHRSQSSEIYEFVPYVNLIQL